MEPLQTIKTFFARLAGAPSVSREASAAGRIVRGRPQAATGPADGTMSAPSRRRSETSKQRDGDEGEAFARRYLEASGLVFVAANVSYRDGELDLVMRDAGSTTSGATLVFIEVRRRAHGTHGGAAGSITRDKRRRVVAAAAHYLVGLGLRSLPPCRFDVVTLDGDRQRGFAVRWIRDAFRDEG